MSPLLLGIIGELISTMKKITATKVKRYTAGSLAFVAAMFFSLPGNLQAQESQTITAPSIDDVTYGVAPFSVAATSSSGLTVSYGVAGPASVDTEGLLTVLGKGSVTVFFFQDGDAGYFPAAPRVKSFTVNGASATVTLADASVAYDGTGQSLTPVQTDSAGATLSEPITVSYTDAAGAAVASPTIAGVYAATATITSGSNYAGSASGTLTITKAAATVTISGSSHSHDGSQKQATVETVPAGLTVTTTYSGGSFAAKDAVAATYYVEGDVLPEGKLVGDEKTPAEAAVTSPSEAGDYEVSVSVVDDNYSGSASATLTIGSISIDNTAVTYSGAAQASAVTLVPADLTHTVTYTDSAGAAVASLTNADTYTVLVTVSDARYPGETSASYTINPAPLTATLGSLTTSYGLGAPSSAEWAETLSYTGFVGTDTAAAVDAAGLTVGYDRAVSDGGAYVATPADLTSGNYAISYTDGSLTVTKLSASVALSNTTQGYTGAALGVTATPSVEGLAVTVVYRDAAGALVAGPTAKGTYYVTATIDDANYEGSKTGTLTITKATTTLELPDLPDVVFSSDPITLEATVTGDRPVIYFVTGAASASGNVVTLNAAGSVRVTAYVAGTDDYESAYVADTFTVSKAGTAVTVTDTNVVYTGLGQSMTASVADASGALLAVDVDISFTDASGNAVASPTDVGVYTATATVNDTRYGGSTTATLTILKAPLTITADDQTKEYLQANPALILTYTGFQNGEDSSVLSTQATVGTAADESSSLGEYGIVVYGAAAANYAITHVDGTLTVEKNTITITLSDTSQTYTGSAFAVTATPSVADVNVVVTYADAAGAAVTNPTSAGTYSVTATADSPLYRGSVTGTLTIAKATATVTLSDLEYTYDGAQKIATVTTDPAGLEVSLTYSSDDILVAPIKAVAAVEAVEAVAAQDAVLYVEGDDIPEGSSVDDVKTPAVTAVEAVEGVAAVAAVVGPSDAGTYSIVGQIKEDNYTGFITGDLVILKKALSATADNITKVYGSDNPAATITYDGLENGEDSTVLDTAPVATVGADVTSGVGDYDITLSAGSDNNYAITTTNGKLSVTRAVVTVTANDDTKIYGTAVPPLGFTSTGYVNGDDLDDIDTKPTVATTATATSDVGAYATTASGGEDNNYSFAYVDGVLAITKATAAITLSDNTATYDGKAHGVTVATTPAGLEGSVNVTYDGSANEPVFVASYAVEASMDDKNYQADNVTDTLTIEQGDDTYVTLAELPDVYYGDPPLDLGLRASTGNRVMIFVSGPAVVGNDESRLVTVNDVGTVDILLYALGAGIPADKRFQAASFEVKKRNLLITADNKSRAYGSDNPELTYTIQGFAPGEDESVFSTAPVLATNATNATGAGDVAITFATEAVDGSGHYAISHQPGALTVTKAPLTITGVDQSRDYGPVKASFFNGKKYINQGIDATRDNISHWRALEITSLNSANIKFYLDGELSAADDQANFTTISRDDFVWDAATRTLAAPVADGAGGIFGIPYTSLSVDVSFDDSFTQATLVFTGNVLETAADSPDVTAQIQGFAAIFSNINIVDDKNVSVTWTMDVSPAAYTYSGFVNGEDSSVLSVQASSSLDAPASSPIGDYPIVVSGAEATNYEITHVNGTMAVGPATLIISGDDSEIFETEALPALTYTATGFVNDEDASVITAAGSLSTDADSSVVGDYAIVASGVTATNYEAVYVNGNLKVKTVAKPKITGLAVSDTTAIEGDKVTITATATGDLLTYDWYLGANLIQSGPSNTLIVTDIGEDEAGRYSVFAKNFKGKARKLAKIKVAERSNEVFLVAGGNSSSVDVGDSLLAKWDFNDASDPAASVDSVAGIKGVFAGGAKYGDGRFGAGTALDVSGVNGAMLVEDGGFLNAASALNTITIVFWQKVVNRTSSTSFNAYSASSGSGRAAHGHVPWGGGDIYWDTAGCCDGGTQRINKGWGGDYSNWNQFVFVKNGDTKEIWVNGAKLHSGTNTSALPTDITRLSVGANISTATDQGSSSVDGLIDDFRVYSSALGGDQILQMYLAESGLNAEDLALKQLLEGEGYKVSMQGPTLPLSDVDARHMSAVIISSTLQDDTWAAKYAGTTTPIINLDSTVQDALGFISPVRGSNLSGTVGSATQLQIVDATHALAGGLPAGAQTVLSAAGELGWGTPNAAAAVVATAGSASHQAAVYGYENGASMAGGSVAAGRRVNLPFQTSELASLTAEGGALLVAAVDWVTGFSIIDSGADLSVTVGDSLILEGTTTGDNITYQWYKNGSAIDGATASSLDLGSLQAGDSGTYKMVATNPAAVWKYRFKEISYEVTVSARGEEVVLVTGSDALSASDSAVKGILTSKGFGVVPATAANANAAVLEGRLMAIVSPSVATSGATVYENASNNGAYFASVKEFGDEVNLGLHNRLLDSLSFEYYGDFTAEGDEKAVVRIYANDGAGADGVAQEPGTMLYESDPIAVAAGYNSVTVSDLLIEVPGTITWTVQFFGVGTTAGDRAGLVLHNPPSVGSSFDDFWVNNGEVIYNATTDSVQAYYKTGTEFGDEINLGGNSRLLNEFDFEAYAEISSSSSTATATLRIYANDGPTYKPVAYESGSQQYEVYYKAGTEFGDEVDLKDVGHAAINQLAELSFEAYGDAVEAVSGTAILRIYANDGDEYQGTGGTLAASKIPGTLLYTSDAINLKDGYQTYTVSDISGVTLPSKLTWTVEFSAGANAGLVLGGNDIAGSSLNDFWQKSTEWTLYQPDNGSENADFAAKIAAKSSLVDANVPGTLLFTSDPITLSEGHNTYRVAGIGVELPDTVTWTVEFSGVSGNELNVGNRAALVLSGTDVVGSSLDDFWQKDKSGWMIYRTNGTNDFGARLIAQSWRTHRDTDSVVLDNFGARVTAGVNVDFLETATIPLVVVNPGLQADWGVADNATFDVGAAMPSGAVAPNRRAFVSTTDDSAAIGQAIDWVLETGFDTTPSGAELEVGESYTLSAAGYGPGAITYQWKKDGANIDGQTGADLALDTVAKGDAGNYSVVVTASNGGQAEASAEVKVFSLPEITLNKPVEGSTTSAITHQVKIWALKGIDKIDLATASIVINGVNVTENAKVKSSIRGIQASIDLVENGDQGTIPGLFLGYETLAPGDNNAMNVSLSFEVEGGDRVFTRSWAYTLYDASASGGADIAKMAVNQIFQRGDDLYVIWPGSPGLMLERSSDCKGGAWESIPSTVGKGIHVEKNCGTKAFFRLVRIQE